MCDWIKWCNGGGMVHKDAIIHQSATVGEWAIVGERAKVGEWATVPSALTVNGYCICHVTATDIAVGCNTFPAKWWLTKGNIQKLAKKHNIKPHDAAATLALLKGVHEATRILAKAGLLSWPEKTGK